MTQLRLHIPADHPCTEGHFPGNPIVPAAVLLDEILRAIERTNGCGPGVWTVAGAKFLHPVRPGDALDLSIAASNNGEVRFACSANGRSVVMGRAYPTPKEPG